MAEIPVSAPVTPKSNRAWKWLATAGVAAALGWLAFGASSPIVQPSETRTNFLLLGIGGEGHFGGNLADSIIVASVRGDRAVLLSVPRDLYIDINGIREGRINAAHAIGEARYDDGIGLMRTTLENTLNIPIHHYVRVDFEGFVNAVDALGGIPVHFEQPLYDRHFEDEYGVLDFAAGDHVLDGQSALYAARSRMTSARGDFDRSARQRAILMGLKDRLISLDVLTDPSALQDIFDAAGTHLRSSLSLYDAWKVYHLTRDVQKIESIGLGDVNGLLQAKRIDGADVLVPATGDLAGVHTFAQSFLP